MLSEKELVDFERDGFCGPFDLAQADRIDQLLKAVLAKQTFAQANDNFKAKHILSENKEVPLVLPNMHLERADILDVACDPEIVGRLVQLMGDEVYLRHSQFWRKIGRSRGVIWHQDTHRKLGLGRIGEFSAWVALEDATIENGCVWLARGSHKGGIVAPETVSTAMFQMRFFGSDKIEVPAALKEYEIVPMEVKKGQFFMFHQLCFHASGPNKTDGTRTGLAYRYLSDPDQAQITQALTKITGTA